MNNLSCRFAELSDGHILAAMNQQLILDEGHRNPLDLAALTKRMHAFLSDGYKAIIFETTLPVGYALFRYENDHVFLRQFFILPDFRRQGYGRAGMDHLLSKIWNEQKRLRLEVLIHNDIGLAFWHSLGLEEYSLTLEMEIPD